MPVENSRGTTASGKVDVDYVDVAKYTCIFGSTTEDAQFVEIVGESTHSCGMPLSSLAFLIAACSPFICLMESGDGHRQDSHCPGAIVGQRECSDCHC
jgi:hypothetical protein